MARVTGPFMSIDASGSIAKTLTASIWKGRNYIKGFSVPTYTNTAAQAAARALFAAAVAAWHGFVDEPEEPQTSDDWEIKSIWNAFGATCQPPISGFNAHVKWYCDCDGTVTAMPPGPFVGKSGIR